MAAVTAVAALSFDDEHAPDRLSGMVQFKYTVPAHR
jgi:hypothetical protein